MITIMSKRLHISRELSWKRSTLCAANCYN